MLVILLVYCHNCFTLLLIITVRLSPWLIYRLNFIIRMSVEEKTWCTEGLELPTVASTEGPGTYP
jgi:hypothetical protein